MEVAKVYADSLLALANESNAATAVQDEFDGVIALMDREAEFARFMESPAMDVEDRQASLERLFRGKMNDTLLNALLVLNRRGRANVVRDMHRQYRQALQLQLNQAEVEVTSAAPLDDDVRSNLTAALKQALGKDIQLVAHVDESLIGGLRIQSGDRRLDASVSGHLKRLKAMLQERASREIHGGRTYFEGIAAD